MNEHTYLKEVSSWIQHSTGKMPPAALLKRARNDGILVLENIHDSYTLTFKRDVYLRKVIIYLLKQGDSQFQTLLSRLLHFVNIEESDLQEFLGRMIQDNLIIYSRPFYRLKPIPSLETPANGCTRKWKILKATKHKDICCNECGESVEQLPIPLREMVSVSGGNIILNCPKCNKNAFGNKTHCCPRCKKELTALTEDTLKAMKEDPNTTPPLCGECSLVKVSCDKCGLPHHAGRILHTCAQTGPLGEGSFCGDCLAKGVLDQQPTVEKPAPLANNHAWATPCDEWP